jgi:hypothetical protein
MFVVVVAAFMANVLNEDRGYAMNDYILWYRCRFDDGTFVLSVWKQSNAIRSTNWLSVNVGQAGPQSRYVDRHPPANLCLSEGALHLPWLFQSENRLEEARNLAASGHIGVNKVVAVQMALPRVEQIRTLGRKARRKEIVDRDCLQGDE